MVGLPVKDGASPVAAPGTVDRAVERALDDGAADYEARGVLVVPQLDAGDARVAHPEVVDQVVYTLLRGLPARLPPGAVLHLSTRERPAGVEFLWEAREEPRDGEEDAPPPRDLLRIGPYGDLFEVALLGLEAICAAEARVVARREAAAMRAASLLSSVAGGMIRRRFVFLIPREPSPAET